MWLMVLGFLILVYLPILVALIAMYYGSVERKKGR